jgi:hypothetical protein
MLLLMLPVVLRPPGPVSSSELEQLQQQDTTQHSTTQHSTGQQMLFNTVLAELMQRTMRNNNLT